MPHPLLYEINARCWLRELSEKNATPITLANVPDSEFETWKRFGFTHIWLMGVWASGPLARTEALRAPEQRQAYSEALPDWTEADVAGSPYAVADYHVPASLGGDDGLAAFRRRLNAEGMKLILDFVPNHLGLDHTWIEEFPGLFVQAIPEETASSPQPSPPSPFAEEKLRRDKTEETERTDSVQFASEGLISRQTSNGMRIFAHGKDPNFPAWTDTVQLDYRRPKTHGKMLELLTSISQRCDGVRCDMAMLILPEVFTQTWSRFPNTEYALRNTQLDSKSVMAGSFWLHAIATVKSQHPDFLFLAEAYWGLEPRLQTDGFDFTYDKELYDRLVARDAAGVQRHLLKQLLPTQKPGTCHLPLDPLPRGAHFLENHDERRVASILSPAEHRAAALMTLALPGVRFLHEGQLTGARRRLPVQLTRRAHEPAIPEVVKIYRDLLAKLPLTAVGRGSFEVLKPRSAWSENPTAENIILVQWQCEPGSFDLVAVNFAAHESQCYAPLTIANLSGQDWRVRDLLGAEEFIRNGHDLASHGLYLDLPPYAGSIFHFSPATPTP